VSRPRLAVIVAALTLVAVPRPSGAQTTHDPAQRFPVWGAAVKRATQLAVHHWGLDPCGGHVAVRWARIDPGVNARSTWDFVPGAPDDPRARTNCVIALNAASGYDWPKLCTILIHEYGHLTGHAHSDDEDDVMSPYYSEPATMCAATPEPRGASSRAITTRHTGGVTVAIACGGRHGGRPRHGLRACHAG
jgi:hypothetical protein